MPQEIKQIVDKLVIKDLSDEEKNYLISLTVTELVKNGLDVETALDLVLGAGTYRKIANDVWETLNAKKEGGK